MDSAGTDKLNTTARDDKPGSPRARIPLYFLRAVFKKELITGLFKLNIPPERELKLSDYISVHGPGVRIYTERAPQVFSAMNMGINKPDWQNVGNDDIHTLLNFYSISTTVAKRRAAIRRMLSEYGIVVVYRVKDAPGEAFTIPAEIVNQIIPYWFDWLFEAYDWLQVMGYAPIAFYKRRHVFKDRAVPIPVVIAPHNITVQVNSIDTGMRYRLEEVAKAAYHKAYILCKTMPKIGHSYDFDEYKNDMMPMASIQTSIAMQLIQYRRYRRYIADDIANITLNTCKPIVIQVPTELVAQKGGTPYIATDTVNNVEVRITGANSIDNAQEIAAQKISLIGRDVPEPRGSDSDKIYANFVRIPLGFQSATPPNLRIESTRDQQQYRLDSMLAALSGYPDIGHPGASPDGSRKDVLGRIIPPRVQSTGGSSSKQQKGGSYQNSGSSINIESSVVDASAFISELEDLLTLAWNIAFAPENGEFLEEITVMLKMLHKDIFDDVKTPRYLRKLAVPQVHINVPKVPAHDQVDVNMFDIMDDTRVLWPLSNGITPRTLDRMQLMGRVYPAMRVSRPMQSDKTTTEEESQSQSADVASSSSVANNNDSSHIGGGGGSDKKDGKSEPAKGGGGDNLSVTATSSAQKGKTTSADMNDDKTKTKTVVVRAPFINRV
jgi:hypothetical protein